jgi:hypothetical protein
MFPERTSVASDNRRSQKWQGGSFWEAAYVFHISAYNPVLPRLIPAAFALLLCVTLSCLVPAVSVPVTARNEGIPFHGLPSQGTSVGTGVCGTCGVTRSTAALAVREARHAYSDVNAFQALRKLISTGVNPENNFL